MTMAVTGVIAVMTVAVRSMCSSNAISPKNSPGPSSTSVPVPAPPRRSLHEREESMGKAP